MPLSPIRRRLPVSRSRTAGFIPTRTIQSTGSTTQALVRLSPSLAAKLYWPTKTPKIPPSLLCWLISTKKNTSFGDFSFDDATLSASNILKDGSQIGIQLFQDIKNLDNRRLTLGYRKALTKDLTFKAKIDTSMNASVFSEYKCGSGIAVQTTIATNLQDDYRSKGFLENNFALGVKLKYDS